MRKDDFLCPPERIGDRKLQLGDSYQIVTALPQFDIEGPIVVVSDSSESPKDPGSRDDDADAAFAKRVYLDALAILDRLQSTWGRVQQSEEMKYGTIIKRLADVKRHKLEPQEGRKVLEEFEGFVERYDGAVAHVTLKTRDGELLYGEYPAAQLTSRGVREKRRFKCSTVEIGNHVEFVIEPIPDLELSEQQEREIDAMLDSLGDDNAQQNDY